MSDQNPLEELKLALRMARAERNLTMPGLERRAGLGHTTASEALNGPKLPTEATVRALASALQLEVDPLLKLRSEAESRRLNYLGLAQYSDRATIPYSMDQELKAEAAMNLAQIALMQGLEAFEKGELDKAMPQFEQCLEVLEDVVHDDNTFLAAHAEAEYLLGITVGHNISKSLGLEFMGRALLSIESLLEEEMTTVRVAQYWRFSAQIVFAMLELGEEKDLAVLLASESLDRVLRYMGTAVSEHEIRDHFGKEGGEVIQASVQLYAMALKEAGRTKEMEVVVAAYNAALVEQ